MPSEQIIYNRVIIKKIILQNCQRNYARGIDILNCRTLPKCDIIMLPLQEKSIFLYNSSICTCD